ncbi:MAG: uracil-DNA glycosylase [Rhizobiales bacterium]|nr:uracil-DNA glycosylase [Hyphomicrobiales bacterium]
MTAPATPSEPDKSCRLCPRLAAFLDEQRKAHPDWFNGPVQSFGPASAQLLIVGLAPGMQGANKTGRPFTGDWAGDLLYGTLDIFGFSRGTFAARPDDGLELVDCMITNAVRCLPPQNKPVGAEIRTCNQHLVQRIKELPNLRAILALGRIAHDATLMALGEKRSAHAFAHAAQHTFTDLTLFDSYHCSRYNTNTRRLTPEMFEAVFAKIRAFLDT